MTHRNEPPRPVDALLYFDANLPGLDHCRPNCEDNEKVLCIHRFKNKVSVENLDPQRFPKWSDLQVLTHFLGHILTNIAKGVADPDNCVFMILTKDRNFIEKDVKEEWEAKKAGRYLPLVFSSNTVSYNGLVVIIQQIDCRVYGNKRDGDLKCAFKKVNDFLGKK